MPETKTWARLGRTTWRVEVAGGDDNDPRVHTFRRRECRSRGEALRWMDDWLPRIVRSTTLYVSGGIQGGTYEDESFDDPGYGHIRDASWNDEGHPSAYCYLTEADAVTVEWYEP